jgi:hypothetical protein
LEETELYRPHRYEYQGEFWVNFFILGGLFLVIAAGLILNTLSFLVKAESVPGTVINSYGPKIAFREETTKRRFEFSPSLVFSLTDYYEDERITVFYDPENPEDVKIEDYTNLFALPVILFLISAFFFLCGFLSSKDTT